MSIAELAALAAAAALAGEVAYLADATHSQADVLEIGPVRTPVAFWVR